MDTKFAIFLILTSATATASADQEFVCGKSSVSIKIDHQLPLRSVEGADVILRVERQDDRRFSLLRFGNIDFIGGGCDEDANGNARIIFQAYCGGSGCNDKSNWGVIDPTNLQQLIAPTDDSLKLVTHLLGHPPKLEGQMMSVSNEAHKYGLHTP